MKARLYRDKQDKEFLTKNHSMLTYLLQNKTDQILQEEWVDEPTIGKN